MFLELLIVLASATQEPSRFGTLAKADQCAARHGDPKILERQITDTKSKLQRIGATEQRAAEIMEKNLADARAANLPAPTEEECQALK